MRQKLYYKQNSTSKSNTVLQFTFVKKKNVMV